ncbi:HxxPF-repeated domain-containing protein, partial [Asanoa hainanensis]
MDKATLAEEIAALEARLAQMRAGVASAPSAAPPGDGQVIPRRDSTRARMSFMQEQLWFLDQLSPGHSTYNLSVFLRLTGDLDLGALERAVSAVTARHETLRTTFTVEYGQPWQIVHPPTPVRLPIHDITVAVGEHPQESLRRALERQANEAFRLDRDRPFRFRLYRVAADEHVFGLTAHHICFDGASASVLLTEVSELYGMARAGAELSLPSLPIQYGDLAEWQQQRLADGALERDITYWAEKLANPTTLELPTDRPRPDLPSFRGDRLSYTIPADVLEGMRALSRRVNATLFATLVAGMTATLSRWSATPDVIIGTANGNRQRPEFQSLVGCLINMLVLRNDVSDDPTLEELIRRSMVTVAEGWDHQAAPFEKIIERIGLPRDPSRNPMFQIAMDLQSSTAFTWTFQDLVVEWISVAQPTARFDLAINTYDSVDGLQFRVEFATDLFDRSRVHRLMSHLELVLRAA